MEKKAKFFNVLEGLFLYTKVKPGCLGHRTLSLMRVNDLSFVIPVFPDNLK